MGKYVLEREFGASSGESPFTCAGKAASLELWSTWLHLQQPSRRSSCSRGEVQVRRTTLSSCLERGKKGFESKAQLCFPVLGFALFCGSASPSSTIRSSPQRKLAAVPALEALRGYCVCTDGQTNRPWARGARGSPLVQPCTPWAGGVFVASFLAWSPGSRTAGKHDLL